MLTFFLFAITGAFAGIMAGMLGVGGGIVVVPGLAFIFASFAFPQSLIMHMAAGTSLAAMIFTASASMYSHHKRGKIKWSVFFDMLPGILIGVILGAIVADLLSTKALSIIFGIFLLLIAFRMFLKLKPQPARTLPGKSVLSGVGILIGLKSGLLGVGGGVLTVPFLVYCNVPIREASGTSAACGLPIAIVGAISFIITGWDANSLPHYATGYVYWPAALAVAIFSVLFVRVGAILSQKLPVKIITYVFAVLLCTAGLNLLF